MKPASQLEGLRQGRLSVLSRVFPNDRGYTRWLCRCDCGKEWITRGSNINRGTQSCGCLGADRLRAAVLKHGVRHSHAYESWAHMIQRCTNPKNKDFARYGGRGIKVCERWLTFVNFYSDMGPCISGLTLDRKENDGNYEPNNCRWATRKEQSHNSGVPVFLTHNGKTQMIAAWAKELGLKADTLYMRLHRGWPIDRALTGSMR